MESEPVKSPSVKSAVHFFNSLSRATSKKNIEINFKINAKLECRKIPRPKLCRLTPDVEAQKIIEDFNKKISPYNSFKLPLNAVQSEFYRQNIQTLLPDVVSSKQLKTKEKIDKSPKRYLDKKFDLFW